ncbi:MAG: PilZ domain-containing protein [Planctomycetota bacterium]|nr:MAG: PilZ domain-containing protein [Planctomycetota bacterium]
MAIRAEEKPTLLSPGKAIYQLIVEAKAALRADRRSDVRYAFFRPVSLEMDDGHRYSAFTREISETGIGLIHNMDLPEGEVEISVRSDGGYSIRVRTRIVWCRACGEGWYISGGRFNGIASIGR